MTFDFAQHREHCQCDEASDATAVVSQLPRISILDEMKIGNIDETKSVQFHM